eukprot:TRINITY_DN24171_c0_g1_i4.p1 TRINITY_DN24171_c0_g1~~TRINITY_DN24171_c0_g1_i4.p1  ORF type:complete len:439 (-),score=96.28 TRINITY_DN24171_c0_g1_i4:32-1348(-)
MSSSFAVRHEQAVQTAESVLGCLLLGIHATSAVFFIRRSDRQPIKGRIPRLAGLQTGTFCIFAFITSLQSLTDFQHCTVPILAQLYAILPLVTTYLRFYLIRNAFYLSQACLTDAYLIRKRERWMKCKSFFQMKYYFLVMFLTIMTIICPILASFIYQFPSAFSLSGTDPLCLTAVKHLNRQIVGIVGTEAVIVFFSTIFLRNVQENIGIRREILSFLGLFLYQVVLICIDLMNPGVLGSAYRLVTFIIPGYFFWFVGVGYVLLQSYLIDEDDVENSKISVSYTTGNISTAASADTIRRDREDLIKLISHDAVRGMLAEFMAQEFSIENLKFILSVRELRDNPPKDQDKMRESIKNIHDHFICEESELCVNISFDCRMKIQRAVVGDAAALSWKIFEEAESEILDLIARDTFKRFKLRSKQYQDWKTEGVILKQMELV